MPFRSLLRKIVRRFSSRLSFESNKREIRRLLLCLLLGISVILVGMGLLEKKFEPLILLCAASEAQNAALRAAGEAVEAAMLENHASYRDIITLEHSADGSLTACRTDTVLVNKVRTSVVDRLDRYFLSDGADISFPIGNIFGSGIFYARGPGVTFRVLPIGTIGCEYESTYETCGINQTRHQLSLQISMNISVLGAGSNEEVEIAGVFPIAETIIIGYVPESYTGLDIGS